MKNTKKKIVMKRVLLALLIGFATTCGNKLGEKVITNILDTPKSELREIGRPQKQVRPQPPVGADKSVTHASAETIGRKVGL
jgi:hypothetical protein